MERPIKVRLTTDLTRYHPKLQVGAEGYTVGVYGMWSRGSDRFIGVRFPEAGTFDILWQSLEIIDEEFQRDAAEHKQKKQELLKQASNVVKAVGPRGGFRYLSYQYPEGHISTSDRAEAEQLLALFTQYGIPVREEVIP